MPYYYPLKKESRADRRRIVRGIKLIREQLRQENFPIKKATESLILGTWNIRNFDDDRFNYGNRTTESMYYIAEILSRFDVVAIQEVCVDLAPLKKLMRILGGEYDYIMTDVTHGSLGGNQERLGFIYNKNKVHFTGVAGEIVLPNKLLISEVDDKKRQFSRTPFGVDFQAGWFKFYFSTVHIYFGSNRGNTPQYKRRVEEIDKVAKYLAKEAKNSDSNHILVGDFNIIERGSQGFNALEKNGFTAVNNKLGSNRDQTKFYDQISFRSKKDELEFVDPHRTDRVFQFFDSVYKESDFNMYRSIMEKSIAAKLVEAQKNLAAATSQRAKKKFTGQIKKLKEATSSESKLKDYYKEWRTFQMSDHLPLWVEIKIDFSDQYLDHVESL